MPAVVDLVESVGADTYLNTAFGPSGSATVRVDAGTTVTEGDHVTLRVAPGGLRLFDADGRRLARAGEAA